MTTQSLTPQQQPEEQAAPEVLVLHLINNHIVVGEVSFTDDGTYHVKQPRQLTIVPNNQMQRMEVKLVPFGALPGVLAPLEEVEFQPFHVMIAREVPQDMLDEYTRVVSGIQIAKTVPPAPTASSIIL